MAVWRYCIGILVATLAVVGLLSCCLIRDKIAKLVLVRPVSSFCFIVGKLFHSVWFVPLYSFCFTVGELFHSVWFVPLSSPYVMHKNTHCFYNYKINGSQIQASGMI